MIYDAIKYHESVNCKVLTLTFDVDEYLFFWKYVDEILR